jgi:hypothetical protein
MIAALRYLDVCGMSRSGEHARSEVMVEVGLGGKIPGRQTFAERGDFFKLVGAENRVDFRNGLLNVRAIPFYQTARHNQPLRFAGFLVLSHLEDGIHRLLLGGIDKAARIDYNDIGLRRLRSQFMATRDELAHHDFAIDEIFRAAETYKSNFQGIIQHSKAGLSEDGQMPAAVRPPLCLQRLTLVFVE